SLRYHFGKKIAAADHVCLTVEVWTHESTMRSYLGLTVHFREGTEIANVETGIRYMPEWTTAPIVELCLAWHIDRPKVRAVVSDGGINIKNAVRDEFGLDRHFSCVAHLLNSVGQAAIGLNPSKVPPEEDAGRTQHIP
ncbi:Transposable element Hobo transposase, partial [Frankliniella fusca]